MGTTRTGNPWRVQTARGIPHVTDTTGWTTHPTATVDQVVLGHGPRLSTAQVTVTWDAQVMPGTPGVTVPTRLLPGSGYVVRLQERTAAGDSPVWADRFLGVVTGITEKPDHRVAMLSLTDLLVTLGRVTLGRGWELATDGTVVDPGYLPPFNALPNVAGGTPYDRSLGRVTMPYSEVYAHDRSGSSSTAWSVRDILELLLREGAHATMPGARSARGFEWDVGDFPARVPPTPMNLDLSGKTPLESLPLLLPASQGYSWRTRLRNDSVVVVDVLDTTVAGTDRALTTVWEQDLMVHQDLEGFDYLQVVGECPIYIVTLYYRPSDPASSLIPDGWINGAPAENTVYNAAIDAPYTSAAWRRWKLNPNWDGSSYGAAGRPLAIYERDQVPNADDHYVAPTGGSYVMPAPRSLVLEATLPDGEGFSGSPAGPRQRATVWAGPVGSTIDISDRVPVQVVAPVVGSQAAEPAGLALGGSVQAAAELCALVGRADTTDGLLLVTVAIRHPRPLCAAWVRDRAAWPFGNPRVRTVRVPNAHLWIRWGGVQGAPLTGTTLRDDTPRLREIRDQHQVRYRITRARARWVERCTVVDDLKPGDVVGTLTVPAGTTTAAGERTHTVQAPVATVTFAPGAAGFDTTVDVVPIALP